MRRPTLYAASKFIGALPDGSVEWRAAAAVQRRQRSPLSLVQRMRGGARLELKVNEYVQGIAFLSRRYESETVSFIAGHLPPQGVFFDVGANVGMISFPIAHTHPGARIVAFEPAPANVEQWVRNRDLNQATNSAIVQAAICDRLGTARFVVVEYESAFGSLTDTGNTNVTTLTLDAYCQEHNIRCIDVLKMDIEGAEEAALLGSRRLLDRKAIGVIVAEAHHDRGADLDRLLEPYGFRQSRIPAQGLRRLPSSKQLNMAWIRQ